VAYDFNAACHLAMIVVAVGIEKVIITHDLMFVHSYHSAAWIPKHFFQISINIIFISFKF